MWPIARSHHDKSRVDSLSRLLRHSVHFPPNRARAQSSAACVAPRRPRRRPCRAAPASARGTRRSPRSADITTERGRPWPCTSRASRIVDLCMSSSDAHHASIVRIRAADVVPRSLQIFQDASKLRRQKRHRITTPSQNGPQTDLRGDLLLRLGRLLRRGCQNVLLRARIRAIRVHSLALFALECSSYPPSGRSTTGGSRDNLPFRASTTTTTTYNKQWWGGRERGGVARSFRGDLAR